MAYSRIVNFVAVAVAAADSDADDGAPYYYYPRVSSCSPELLMPASGEYTRIRTEVHPSLDNLHRMHSEV